MLKFTRHFALSAAQLGLLLVVAATVLPAAAHGTCDRGISPDAAKQLHDHLRLLGTADACVWQGLDTQETQATAHWRKNGQLLSPATVAPHGCLPTATLRGTTLDAQLPADLVRACPGIQTGLPTALGSVREPLPVARDPEGGLFQRTQAPTRGIIAVFAGLWLLALLAAFLLLRAWVRNEPPQRRWLLQLAGVTALALCVRLALPPSLANWYLEVVAPSGMGDARFGPGALGLQRLLFAVLPTSDTTLFAASALAGAAAIPLAMGVARMLGLADLGVLAAGVLLALLPLHVRVSVSGAAHVWASTAQLAALLLWLSGLRRPHRGHLAASGLLAFLALATRVDVFAQLPFIVACGLLFAAPQPEAQRLVRRATALWLGAWLLTGALVWLAVVRPSHHPPPATEEILGAARHLLSQFLAAPSQHPQWLPALPVVLAAVGLLWATLRDRRWLALTALLLVCTFVPLGRTFDHEGLVGGRYFCFAIAWICLLGGAGVAWLAARIASPRARWAVLAVTTVAAALSALPALQARYTFQDEYDFLRAATATLPTGCIVVQLPVRDRSYEGDFDGSIDGPRSPLTLARPDLDWRYLKLGARLPVQPAQCLAYYQTSLCQIRDSREVRERFPRGAETVRRACSEAVQGTSIRRLRSATLSPVSTHNLFDGQAPTVWIGRVGNDN